MEADDAYYHNHCNSGRCHQHTEGPLVDVLDTDNNYNNNNNNTQINQRNNHHPQCSCQLSNASATKSDDTSDQQKAHHLAVINGVPFVKEVNDNGTTIMDAQNNQRDVYDNEEEDGGDSDLDLADHLNRNFVRNRRYTESMVRIQAMAMSDEDDDYGE